MSDVKKVSELDAVTTSASADLIHLATDAGGGTFVSKKITVGNLKSDVLLLDQTTPQTVTGGVPDFSEGISCGGTASGMSTIAAGLTVNNAQTSDANGDFIAKTSNYNALVVDASADEILIGTNVVITSGVYLYFDSASGSSLTGGSSYITLTGSTVNLEGYTHITNGTMDNSSSADLMDGTNVASFSKGSGSGAYVKIFDGTQSLYAYGGGNSLEAKLCGASAAAFADSVRSATFCDGTNAGTFSDGTNSANFGTGTYGVDASSINATDYAANGTPGITQQIIILDGDGVTTHTMDFTLGLLTGYTSA